MVGARRGSAKSRRRSRTKRPTAPNVAAREGEEPARGPTVVAPRAGGRAGRGRDLRGRARRTRSRFVRAGAPGEVAVYAGGRANGCGRACVHTAHVERASARKGVRAGTQTPGEGEELGGEQSAFSGAFATAQRRGRRVFFSVRDAAERRRNGCERRIVPLQERGEPRCNEREKGEAERAREKAESKASGWAWAKGGSGEGG